MDIQEKLEFIKYNTYKYEHKTFNSSETADFFDLDFSKLLYENASRITNSQHDLLSAFDFSEIFSEFNDSVDDRQRYILKFLVIKGVKNVDKLLDNMPIELEFNFFQELYKELHSKDSRPFWFSRIASCLKKEDRVQFVSASIDELADDEILFLIRDLYEEKDDAILTQLMNDERISDIAIKRVNAPFFYEMIEELNLPNSLLERRRIELENILTNYQEYDVSDVKNAFCELHFHDTLKNSLIDIETIIDFANDDSVFREELGEAYNSLCNIYNYLSGDNESSIPDISLLDSGGINNETLSKYYSRCQERFKELVSEAINQDVTENIEPRIVISSSGEEVQVYDIENQTEKQRKVTMLVSTIPCSDSATEFKQIYYSDNNGEIKKNRRSCSLVNQTKLSSLFGGKNRITFGYEDLSGRIITSATLGDGITDGNEEILRKSRKIMKSSYSSVDKFVAGTQGHTEVTVNMGETNQVMQPSYILITRENPTQFEIDLAAEFQIPIRYVNIEKYRQEPNPVYSPPQEYEYFNGFEKKEVQRLKANEGKSGYDDCMEDDTVRASSVQNATQAVNNSHVNRKEKINETGNK